MTIQEAIKSEKRFRRNHSPLPGIQGWMRFDDTYYSTRIFSKEDLLANDWEIEEQKLEISRERFNLAYKRALSVIVSGEDFGTVIARELGFKD